ncbi:Hypothetical protein FKW44_021655, partial [Caligus rogercresseyi]
RLSTDESNSSGEKSTPQSEEEAHSIQTYQEQIPTLDTISSDEGAPLLTEER